MFGYKKLTKEALQDHKVLKIKGYRFVIKKINPILDFESKDIPQIFVQYKSNRPEPDKTSEAQLTRMQRDMEVVVTAGLIEPSLSKDSGTGLVVQDLFYDPELGSKLYFEIMLHSMNRFRGISKLFFSIKTRLKYSIECRKSLRNYQVKSPSPEGIAQY